MPTAFVKYRSGGGFQQVTDYTRVFDARKLTESGYYRDSSFVPSIIIEDGTAITNGAFIAGDIQLGYGSGGQFESGVIAKVDPTTGDIGEQTTAPGIMAVAPDEMMHVAPRQNSWRETTLTFCADSDDVVTFTADNATDTMTATAHGLGGKRFTISAGTTMPVGLLTNVLYYAVNPTANTFQVALSENGPAVNFTSNGSGTLTATVVDTIAEFQWANILGWSNTAPTR
jgi:hypothetical protein